MSVGAPPYARPLLYRRPEDEVSQPADRAAKALELLHLAQDNHQWRQRQCINPHPLGEHPQPGGAAAVGQRSLLPVR